MFKLSVLCLFVAPLFAQLPSHTLTITATRSVGVQPDQVVFGLTVRSSPTTDLNQIVTALSGIGVTSANLSGVDNNNPPLIAWNFRLTASISTLTATLNSLTSLQKTIGQNNSGLALTFTLNGTQSSQQPQCSDSDLIADATAQAQKLAAAANVTLGPIITLSNPPLAPAGGERLGAFAALALVPILAPSPVTCTLSVRFQLLP